MIPVARTRTVVPVVAGHVLPRPRLRARLEQLARGRAFAVVGPAGFGKTVQLAGWAARHPTAWYTVAESDEDEFTFVAHLLAALRAALPSAGWLDDAEPLLRADRWRAVMDAAINGLLDAPPLAMVFDDAHHLKATAPLEYLLRYAPATACVVLGARSVPSLPAWDALAMRGEAEVLGAEELALDVAELAEVCAAHRADPGAIQEATGGWPIAVDFLLRTRGKPRPLDAFLTHEIWSQLEADDRDFLLRCSVLQTLAAEACAAVSGRLDAADRLRRLHADGVFLQAWTDGTWRIHGLFRDFLRERLSREPQMRVEAHRRAALDAADPLDAIAHLLAAGDRDRAGRMLLEASPRLLAQGRHERLLALLDSVEAAPALQLQRGHALRQKGAYEEAAVTFAGLAEGPLRAEALSGLARVYVDTLQPTRALDALRAAWRAAETIELKARILEMLAENCVNQGRSRGALRFRRWARSLVSRRADALDARLLLRTGQLRAARMLVEAAPERGLANPEAHRENVLILAYIAALEGDAGRTEEASRRGLALAAESASPQTEVVSWTRLGHALALRGERDEASEAYTRALTVASTLGVDRLRAEALMGLALLHVDGGDVPRSYTSATEALAICRAAGDEWLTAWVRLVCGISGLRGGHPDAPAIVSEARRGFVQCGDSFGVAVADLWLGEGKVPREYAFLSDRATLFTMGRKAPPAHAPSPPKVLSEAAGGTERSGPAAVDGPPEAGLLRVECLGTLRIWRHGEELAPRQWKREKARELFLILLTRRGSAVHKEQLMDLLFPDADADAANRDFRVALHALSQALDPDRPKNAPARWIERRGSAYMLRADDRLAVDADEFERLASRSGDDERGADFWRRAVALYRGDYLEELPYSDWAQDERERLRAMFFATCERLARFALAHDPDEAVQVAHAMLARDRCSEEAWRLLIASHLALGREFLARRAFEQCAQTLQDELGVEPSAATRGLLE
jgi:DNA-binding SARP family transcriptional activator